MIIRTTERAHAFTTKLCKRLNLFSLQGLTLSGKREFSAAIEAVQFFDNEEIDIDKIFTPNEIKAKYFLANALKLPFYFIIHQNKQFSIYLIETQNEIKVLLINVYDERGFINWYANLKGLPQPKHLMEAQERVKDSIFDQTLVKHGMAWGGNIDGFMFKDKKLACIIEFIFTQKNPLESPKAEPSHYFNLRGPNYNSWYPTVKLASQLNIPLYLFTIEGNSNQDRIGFAVIDHLTESGIFYQGKKPNENIIVGMENIIKTVNENLNLKAPFVY